MRAAAWRAKGLRVGFANGCFDLIHPGHVRLLTEARAACDRLIVALNTDASVKRLKGPTRPVQNETARATVMASLAPVDLVVLFDEETPFELIRAVRPDVLVKGADYREDQVVGGDLVHGWGGRVHLVDLQEGHSTSRYDPADDRPRPDRLRRVAPAPPDGQEKAGDLRHLRERGTAVAGVARVSSPGRRGPCRACTTMAARMHRRRPSTARRWRSM